jgi:uncharacterized protein GlcG (DUF336 family)
MAATPYLTLPEARAIIDRGLAEAYDLGETCSLAVLDAGGIPISVSRMDDTPVAALHMARNKAYTVATGFSPEIETHIAGGIAVLKDGRVVGGLGEGGLPEAVQSQVLRAALSERASSLLTDLDDALPLTLAGARRLADRSILAAEAFGAPIGVAILDELGRLLQVDRMEGSPMGSCDMAEAKARSALKFQRPTVTLTEEFRSHSARMEAIEKIVGFTILAMGGGVPIEKDGRIVGAIGISGSGGTRGRDSSITVNDHDIALKALEMSS